MSGTGKTGRHIESDVARALQVVSGSTSLLVDEVEKMQEIITGLKEENKELLTGKALLDGQIEVELSLYSDLNSKFCNLKTDYEVAQDSIKFLAEKEAFNPCTACSKESKSHVWDRLVGHFKNIGLMYTEGLSLEENVLAFVNSLQSERLTLDRLYSVLVSKGWKGAKAENKRGSATTFIRRNIKKK